MSSSLYKNVDSEALNLLRRMLKADPKDRIKASDILTHPYLAGTEMDIENEKYTLSPASTVSSVRGINFSQAERLF